jgi:hypothetical protein
MNLFNRSGTRTAGQRAHNGKSRKPFYNLLHQQLHINISDYVRDIPVISFLKQIQAITVNIIIGLFNFDIANLTLINPTAM